MNRTNNTNALPGRIDRYIVKRIVGEGGVGKIFLADDPKLKREVAIKVLLSNADNDVRNRFRLEARAIAALTHPNIIELYDFSDEEASDLYLVMEWIPGSALFDLVDKHGVMSEATAVCVGHELALALEHAHAKNVVHRDLKPENVLLHEGRVVLTDFGAVKAVASDNPLQVDKPKSTTKILGTPGFMAPEQFAGKKIGPSTDIFALGATLYNLSTGKVPYEGRTVDETYRKLLRGDYESPDQHHRLLTNEFCEFLGHCLAPKPRDRFGSASEVREYLLDLMALHGISEVRKELVRYEKSPALSSVEQREQSTDALLKELKVALKDKDMRRARNLINRIQKLAPLDGRIKEVSGVSFDTQPMRRMVGLLSHRVAVRKWASVAFLLGIGVGWAAAQVWKWLH